MGLITEYLPTVMALVLISSEMHLLAPDGSSNRIEFATVNAELMMKMIKSRLEDSSCIVIVGSKKSTEFNARILIGVF